MAETITPVQALNELRGLLSTYNNLKRAEGILSVLAEADTIAKKAQADSQKATDELVSTNKELEEVKKAHAVAKSDLSDTKAKTAVVLTDAKDYAESIVSRANKTGDEIRANAQAQADAITKALETSKRELAQLESAVLVARDKHEAYKSHALAEKAKIVETLTSMGAH